jgi:hypothetical protein
MNFWLKGNVTIPARPHTVGGLIGWARGVNRALTELRDRKIVGTAAKRSGTSPLKLTIKQGTAADKFQIVPGTVNDEMPELSATALDDATPPEITVAADVWVWVKCVGLFDEYGEDTYTVTIETSATSTMPSGSEITATGFTSFRKIGNVDFTAGSPDTFAITNTHSGGDLGVESFGNVNHWWKV